MKESELGQIMHSGDRESKGFYMEGKEVYIVEDHVDVANPRYNAVDMNMDIAADAKGFDMRR